MNIGDAVAALKDGKSVRRAKWHGRDCMFFAIGPNGTPSVRFASDGKGELACTGHFFIEDVLAEDWEVV